MNLGSLPTLPKTLGSGSIKQPSSNPLDRQTIADTFPEPISNPTELDTSTNNSQTQKTRTAMELELNNRAQSIAVLDMPRTIDTFIDYSNDFIEDLRTIFNYADDGIDLAELKNDIDVVTTQINSINREIGNPNGDNPDGDDPDGDNFTKSNLKRQGSSECDVIVYVRTDPKGHTKRDKSLEKQKKRCSDLALKRKEKVVKVIEDKNISGDVHPKDRDGWKELLLTVMGDKNVEGIRITSRDRISSNKEIFEEVITTLHNRNVWLLAVDEENETVDEENPDPNPNRDLEGIQGVIDNYNKPDPVNLAINWLRVKIRKIITALKNFTRKAVTALKSIIKGAWNSAKKAVARAWEAFLNRVKRVKLKFGRFELVLES